MNIEGKSSALTDIIPCIAGQEAVFSEKTYYNLIAPVAVQVEARVTTWQWTRSIHSIISSHLAFLPKFHFLTSCVPLV